MVEYPAFNRKVMGSNPMWSIYLWPLSLKVRTQPFQGWDIGFKSHRGHCGHSIMVSTADCGSAHGGSIPPGHPKGR